MLGKGGVSSGGEFVLTTGVTEGGEGFGHTLEVWNNEDIPMNGTATNHAVEGSSIYLVEGGIPSLEFFVSEETEYDIEVTGDIETSDPAEVFGRFQYFRHMEPYSYWDAPYRFISYGVLGIGLITALITYFRDKSESNA